MLRVDETGWRVSGHTYWLWCFASEICVFYMIDRSLNSLALAKFFTIAFDGTLTTDFWSLSDAVACAEKQSAGVIYFSMWPW
jgi:transposase